jgi:hypothetical protein
MECFILAYFYFVVSLSDYQVIAGPYQNRGACEEARANIEARLPEYRIRPSR